jgi:hypothetical protein
MNPQVAAKKIIVSPTYKRSAIGISISIHLKEKCIHFNSPSARRIDAVIRTRTGQNQRSREGNRDQAYVSVSIYVIYPFVRHVCIKKTSGKRQGLVKETKIRCNCESTPPASAARLRLAWPVRSSGALVRNKCIQVKCLCFISQYSFLICFSICPRGHFYGGKAAARQVQPACPIYASTTFVTLQCP